MFKALARLSFLYNGVHEVGVSRAGRVDGKRATGDATEARRIVRVGPRGPPRGDGDGAAARRGELCLMSPRKTVNRHASDSGLAVSH